MSEYVRFEESRVAASALKSQDIVCHQYCICSMSAIVQGAGYARLAILRHVAFVLSPCKVNAHFYRTRALPDC